MKDFSLPQDLLKFINQKKIKGTIIFFKTKVIHYSSSSRLSSSEGLKGR